MDFGAINWLAVLAAAISTFVLGGLWYSPVLFARIWQRETGLTDERLQSSNMAVIFGGAFVLAFLASAMFAVFLGPNVDAVTGLIYGATAGIFWVGASFGINYLFERKSFTLFLINGGYSAVKFTLIGLILGFWP